METQELLKKVRRLEIKARKSSANLFSGAYHSSFKGRGLSFSEVRPYQAGDEVRMIDWNVTARLREPFVKVLEEDRELSLLLMVDVSASTQFGSSRGSKRETILETCALLAISALKNNDKVGLLSFTDRVESYIPPRKGRSAALTLIRNLVESKPSGVQSDLSGALAFARSVSRQRTIVFLISDFLCPNYSEALKPFGRKHDLIGLKVFDRAERELPDLGMTRLTNPETGRTEIVDTSDPKQRKSLGLWMKKFDDDVRTAFRSCGSDLIELAAGSDVAQALFRLFAQRARR